MHGLPPLQGCDQAGAAGRGIAVIGVRLAHVFCACAVRRDGKAALALGAEGCIVGQRRRLPHDGAAGRCAGNLAAVIGCIAEPDDATSCMFHACLVFQG